MNECKKCGGASSADCSRCREVHYCSRECQKLDWSNHKKECGIGKRIIDFTGTIIMGNIFTMAAHRSQEVGPGIVTVTFEETINNFINKKGGIHCAVIGYVSDHSNNHSDNHSGTQSGDHSIQIEYIFSDYKKLMNASIQPDTFKKIIGKTTSPVDDWPIIFEV